MDNLINYYYGFNVFNLRRLNGNYIFFYKKNMYYFYKVNDLILFNKKNTLFFLTELNSYVHTPIKNRENKFLTYDGRSYYILFKINVKYNKKIEINDIFWFNQNTFFRNIAKKKDPLSCRYLWYKKIDYLEYYVDKRDDWPDSLRCLFNYYVGIAENSIQYLGICKNEFYNNEFSFNCIAHYRVNCFDTFYEFFNPLNFVVDSRTRDVAEYMKSLFLNGKMEKMTIERIIGATDYSRNEYILLVSRILFPTFFWDLLEKIDDAGLADDKLLKMCNNAVYYEKLIEITITVINKLKNVDIPIVKWTIKN